MFYQSCKIIFPSGKDKCVKCVAGLDEGSIMHLKKLYMEASEGKRFAGKLFIATCIYSLQQRYLVDLTIYIQFA